MAKNRPDRYETYQKEYNQRTGYAAQKKYLDSTKTKNVVLHLNTEVYGDVIELLSEIPNKTAYIVSLIRKDIEATAKEKDEATSGNDEPETE